MTSQPLSSLHVVGIRYFSDRSAAPGESCLDGYAASVVYAAAGVPFSVTEPVPGTFRLYTLKRQIHPHVNDARNGVQMDTTYYEGMVYGVDVGGCLICVRHKQTTMLCGGLIARVGAGAPTTSFGD